MVQIPEYFKKKARRQFGNKGPRWVEGLSKTLSKCINRWQLCDVKVVADLSINFLCYATSPHGEVVLKIEGPHSEGKTEMLALELYRGRNVCLPLEIDYDLDAILLERVVPGISLRKAVSEVEQLRIGVHLVRDLPIPVDSATPLPCYQNWLDRAFSSMRERYNPSESFRNSIYAAEEMAAEIPMNGGSLLHGDLHHDNILLGSQGEWKVIDPQGVIGAPVMECGRFIQNHAVDGHNRLDLQKAYGTVNYVASVLEQSQRKIWIAFFILHVLSFCWGYEMNYTSTKLKKGAGECAAILEAIPG